MAELTSKPPCQATMADNNSNASSSFEILFNAAHPLVKDLVNPQEQLRRIRNKIYSYAWSRDRRDQHKLDFVISQWGINRNVPERFIPDTPYGIQTFENPKDLHCNLHLANKKISADFCRYIYTVNDLEVDIDLKAEYTDVAASYLHNIIRLLRNPNLLKYTRAARIRIHFPYRYTMNKLPGFNQRALEDIAMCLDEFKQLEYLALRVVLAQGAPLDYELRLAAFPFYPMRLTKWSIRTLNHNTLRWDRVEGQQIKILDKAWELYQDTESLDAAVDVDVSIDTRPAVRNEPLLTRATVSAVAEDSSIQQHKFNGSQKRKVRKQKAAAALVAGVSTPGSATSMTSFGPKSSFPMAPQHQVSSTSDVSINGDVIVSGREVDAGASGRPEGPDTIATGSSDPNRSPQATVNLPSPPKSPAKLPSVAIIPEVPSSDTSSGECILTPVDSIEGETSVAFEAGRVDTKPREIAQHLSTSRPPSPAPSSDADEISGPEHVKEIFVAVETPKDSKSKKLHQQKKGKKNKKKGKKKGKKRAKKTETTSHPLTEPSEASVENADSQHEVVDTNPEQIDDTDYQSEGSSVEEVEDIYNDDVGAKSDAVASHRDEVNLADLELRPLAASNYAMYMDATGTTHFVARTPQINRLLRQQERQRFDKTRREAEKKQSRSNRHLRKAKELALRRENIDEKSPLYSAARGRDGGKKQDVADEDEKDDGNDDDLSAAAQALQHLNLVLALRRARDLLPRSMHTFNFTGEGLELGEGHTGLIEDGFKPEVDLLLPQDHLQDEPPMQSPPSPVVSNSGTDGSLGDARRSSLREFEAEAAGDYQNNMPTSQYHLLPIPESAHMGSDNPFVPPYQNIPINYRPGEQEVVHLRDEATPEIFEADQDGYDYGQNRNRWNEAVVANDDAVSTEQQQERTVLDDMEMNGTEYSETACLGMDSRTETDEQ